MSLPTIYESRHESPISDYYSTANRFRLLQQNLFKSQLKSRTQRTEKEKGIEKKAAMCKTCLRKVDYEGDENWGPWGISSAYTSASLTFKRLLAAKKVQNGEGEDHYHHHKEESEIVSPLKNFSPILVEAVREKKGESQNSSGERKVAFCNVVGGSPLSHTHVPSHAHSQVGADEGDLVYEEDNTCEVGIRATSGATSNLLNFFKRSGSHSKVKKNAKITKDSAAGEHHDEKKSDGSKIVKGDSLSGATEVDVVGITLSVGGIDPPANGRKLESSIDPKSDHRPFFYLPSDEDDSTIDDVDRELLNDPDLYPVPKHIPSTPRSSPSSQGKPISPLSPQSPIKTTINTTTTTTTSDTSAAEIRNRIRGCLRRARSRSASLCGIGSFEAGLYRLEGLLEDDSDEDPKSEPFPSGRSFSRSRPEHVRAPMPKYKNASTITDVCTNANVAEVELISIVQEQIPRYKLRADTVTEFSGYDNADWGVTFPALKEEEAEALSPEQAEGALAYFVLCGNRVSQMTKTYNDIDAVTRLLQEKEKDLELAAKIGQQLLARNKTLEERNAILDSELTSAGEKITQLTHNLQMKTELLQIYTNDVDDTSSCENTPTGMRLINVDFLQHRVRNLEDENKSLRQEASQLAFDTQECEDKEKELVADVIKQLSDANLQVRQLSDDLAKKVEDSLRQQEEITQLLAQVVDLQSRNKRLVVENDELHNMVGVARDCQQELTMELAELKEKYAEVLDLLHDTQDQLRRVQKKNLPGSRGHHLSSSLYSSPFSSGNDSIANELQSLNSIGEEMGKGNVKHGALPLCGLSQSALYHYSNSMRRTFDTVRLSGRYAVAGSQGSLSSLGYGGSVHSTPTHHPHTPLHMSYGGSRGSSVYSGGSGHPSLDSGADSDASMHTDSEDNYPGSHLGVPGWPGTPDLDSCLRRLGPADRSGTPSRYLPYGCRTPDSIMSTGSGKSGVNEWRLPQKLQIVKPIEGSMTLSQWSRLATPNLAGLLEEREGVAIKGGAGIEQLKLDVYSMSDLEEDEPEEENPGKRFMSTSGVFTYTNSTILHPDDQTTSTRSLNQAQVSILPAPTVHPTQTPGTPIRAPSCPASRRGSTATFSTNTGLAKVLNERGMNHQSVFSPTATPANSPTGSQPGSPEPEGYKLPGLEDLTKTFHYGASLLRRTFYRNDPSAPQSPLGPRVNLVEQVQAIGVDRFVGSGQVLSVGGVVTSRPATSPLLHLSNLIMSSAKTTTSAVSLSTETTVSSSAGVMFVPKVLSPGERRPTIPSGAPMGIPGHPGSGHLDNRLSQLKPGQRADLGTVGGRSRPTSLGTVPPRGSGAEQNVGTVGWTSFGRKGGLL